MRKLLILLLLTACAVGLTCHAEDAGDSESALLDRLTAASGARRFSLFEYGDYDCDGVHEAFALLPESDWDNEDEGYRGELWFVSPKQCARIRKSDSYLTMGKVGMGPMLFTAEVWYGGSGSTSVVWGVRQSQTVEVLGEQFEGISAGDMPNEFYMYPSAFDMSSDGTGHTWKRYYFFLDGLELKEYGGLKITRGQLEAVDGAEAILKKAESEGWTIGDIYYRSNGIINVNMHDDMWNDNLTLRVDSGTVVDTQDRYGGVYRAESGLVRNVRYPDSFDPNVVRDSQMKPAAAETNARPEGVASATRAQILQARGVFDVSALTNVVEVNLSDEGNNQRLRIYCDDQVYAYIPVGFRDDWLTASGAVSEAYVDLDNDGADEYVLIDLMSERMTLDGGSWWKNTWYLAIFEPNGDEWKLVCEFPFGFQWEWDSSVKLVSTNDGLRIMVSKLYYEDGGSCGISATLYGYDGECAYVDLIMSASIGDCSYIAYGPFNIDNEDRILEALEGAKTDSQQLRYNNLIVGQNCLYHWCDDYTEREIYNRDEQRGTSVLNPNAFTGFDEIMRAFKKTGIIAGYSGEQTDDGDDSSASFRLKILTDGTTLLSSSVEWEDASKRPCINLTVHHTGQPFIRSLLPGSITVQAEP